MYADKSSPADLSGITHLLKMFPGEGLDFNSYFKISWEKPTSTCKLHACLL